MTGTDVVLAPRASMPDKVEYARVLAESGLLPAQYRKQPANVLYACEYGEMLGLSPMAAIIGVHIIEGKPSASAALISALVRKAGHRLRITGDDQRAVAEITRSDDPGFTFRVEWTLERARNAGLLSKDIWKKYGPNMLKHRAVSECANDACEEVLFGLITPEELGAEVDKDGEPLHAIQAVSSREPEPERLAAPDWDSMVTNAESTADLAKLRQLWDMAKGMFPNDRDLLDRIAQAAERVKSAAEAATFAEPPVEPEPPAAEPTPDAAPPDRNQRNRLYALLRDGGVTGTDRTVRLRIVSRILSRPPNEPVTSFDELSPQEMLDINRVLQAHKDDGDLIHRLAELGAPTLDFPSDE